MSDEEAIDEIIARALYALAPCYTNESMPGDEDWEASGPLLTIAWDTLSANDQDVQPAHMAKAAAIRVALAAKGYAIWSALSSPPMT